MAFREPQSEDRLDALLGNLLSAQTNCSGYAQTGQLPGGENYFGVCDQPTWQDLTPTFRRLHP